MEKKLEALLSCTLFFLFTVNGQISLTGSLRAKTAAGPQLILGRTLIEKNMAQLSYPAP